MTTVFKPTPKHQYQISFFNCQINTYDEIDRYAWFNMEELNDIEVFPDIKISYQYILDNIIK